ncbi:MAG: hypothetical protein ABI835_16825 [Chloroflexota bacterium]
MSYQERRAIVSVISSFVVTVVYSAYMIQRFPAGDAYSPDVFRFWGVFFFILIPVSIVAKIGVYIIASIINTIATREVEPSITDERDRLIDLKGTRNSFYIFVAGFLLAMATLVLEMPPSAMFIMLICAGVVSELVGDLSQFYFYRRGY